MPSEQTRFANFALGLNATFCSVVGLVFTLTGAFMADWLGVRGWILTVFGVVVMFWSLVVTLYANRRVTRRNELDRVVTGNAAWAGFGVVTFFAAGSLTDAGQAMVGIGVMSAVTFIVAQLLARRTLDAPAMTTPPSDDETSS